MLGSLRLLLALGVVVFHAGWQPFGLRIGVACVVIFYIISGYAMSGLARAFLRAPEQAWWAGAWHFWRDRILRLYPQYLLWVLVAFILICGFNRRWFQQQGPLNATALLGNLTMAPLSLYMFIPSLDRMLLLPQGWSLSTEVGFYALFPFVWRWRTLEWLALGVGCTVLALAMAGVLQPEWFGYRLLPGTLPFFLLGRAIYTRDRLVLGALTGFFAAAACLLTEAGRLDVGFNRELLLAALTGPALLVLATRVRAWRFDEVLGHVSYGTYLAHIAVLTSLPAELAGLAPRMAAAAVLSAAGGWASWAVVEVRVNRYRHLLRGRGARSGGFAPCTPIGDKSPNPIT